MDEGIDQKIREGKLKFDAIKDDVREEVNKQKGKVEKIIKDGKPLLREHVKRTVSQVRRIASKSFLLIFTTDKLRGSGLGIQ